MLSLTTITFLSLLYVHQQTEIVRFAYITQKKAVFFQELLDKNNLLRYNIEKNTSLTRIGDKIYDNSDYSMPNSYQLVRLYSPRSTHVLASQAVGKENIFARLLGTVREAQAKTIKP
jgi:hypothetical protein